MMSRHTPKTVLKDFLIIGCVGKNTLWVSGPRQIATLCITRSAPYLPESHGWMSREPTKIVHFRRIWRFDDISLVFCWSMFCNFAASFVKSCNHTSFARQRDAKHTDLCFGWHRMHDRVRSVHPSQTTKQLSDLFFLVITFRCDIYIYTCKRVSY